MAKDNKKLVQAITSQEENFAQWYTDICVKAELVEYSSVKGFIILRPYGQAIWELIQKDLDARFKATGHENVAMPVLIPESLLQKEGELVNGFAPEVAWVTMGGSDKLEERLAVRPTSETMFCDHWSRVLHSYRELPMKYNQWCSVVRWEKTTRPFLRSREFWWQEGHTIHETAAEAEAETLSDEELTALKEELASKMAADTQGDEQAFIDQAYENCLESAKETYAEDSATLKENQLYSSLSTDVADWLFDAGRAEGDTTYIATDSVYYVLYFVSRSTNDYQLPNVRHILFSVSDTTDETAMDEARTKAEDVLTEYEAGDKTAESFGELAKEYTADSNGDEGGLYENIMPGQMVTEFNDWCFDADRKPGDTGIIETSYGVHVMYFDSFGKIYRDALVENALRSADYNAWYDATAGDGSYTTSAFGMKYTTK